MPSKAMTAKQNILFLRTTKKNQYPAYAFKSDDSQTKDPNPVKNQKTNVPPVLLNPATMEKPDYPGPIKNQRTHLYKCHTLAGRQNTETRINLFTHEPPQNVKDFLKN